MITLGFTPILKKEEEGMKMEQSYYKRAAKYPEFQG
jgi:hypothetical protein